MNRIVDAGEAAETLGAALESASIPYAIGGALAMGVHGYPRGTLDVDVNVFIELEDIPRLADVLRSAGAEVDDAQATGGAGRDGMFVARYRGLRLDVFVPSIPFSWEASRTKTRVGRNPLWFLSAESVAVFKLLFFRGKDRVDLERFVAARGQELDHAYVRRWLAEMMGADDERVKFWDDVVQRFGA